MSAAAAAAAADGGKPAPTPSAASIIALPPQGVARVKSVLSGDSVILLGAAPPNSSVAPPEVVFTLEGLLAPRMASKSNPTDEAGAFPAREWLRKLVVGKQVRFQTRKQGNDRVYGLLYTTQPNPDADANENLALECVRQGHATPKSIKYGATPGDTVDPTAPTAGGEKENGEQDFESQLVKAYQEAKEARRGIHSIDPVPLVRHVKNAVDDFTCHALVEACKKLAANNRIQCVIEYIFDGSRYRCQVTDPAMPPEWQNATFTLFLAGVTCPRMGNTRTDPPQPQEEFAMEAKNFVTQRLLQRELYVGLLGTDKNGMCCAGSIYHPAGNIAVEILKNGLGRMTDWSVRLLPPMQVPPLRVAENNAKRTHLGVWHSYTQPTLQSASQVHGTVVEVISGDTLSILPAGKPYDSEAALFKVSLASVRAPRVGSTMAGRPDEPYATECKDKLKRLVVGRTVACTVHYERDIPIRPGVNEKRPFATIKVVDSTTPSKVLTEDVSEVLIRDGLATTQRHRDDDEKSPRYDELRAAEALAGEAKKGLHNAPEKYKSGTVNDLTDPRKAKAYSGSLTRAGRLKAVVDYAFNGALFKLFIPSENCHIRFAPNYIRCPQPSPNPGATGGKPGEPFGDEAKRHARLHVLQRVIEVSCSNVTNGGVIVGSMWVRSPTGGQSIDYTLEMLGSGLARLDQRKVDYGEVPKPLMDAQAAAKENKVGIWSVEQEVASAAPTKTVEKVRETAVTIRLSEIRSGSHFFYHVVKDDASKVIEESMKLFTQNNGKNGAPCDVKINKVVAAAFDDGTGKSWYRAKIVERKGHTKVAVLFVDHGNISTVPISSHLRPLDPSLGTDKIPPAAKEATLALTVTRSLETDEGIDAARLLQSICWDKDLSARVLGPDDNGKPTIVINDEANGSVNAQLVGDGLARVAKEEGVRSLASRMVEDKGVLQLAADLNVAQEAARRSRVGMWRYGDIGDDDDEE